MAFVQFRLGVGVCRSGSFWPEVLDKVLDGDLHYSSSSTCASEADC